MSIEETYKTIDLIVRSFKKSRQENDYLTLMTNGLALLEYMPTLINYSVEQESEYRKFEAKLLDTQIENKHPTSSYCDTKAKAGENYKNWQKAKQFTELLYNLVNMAKKLAGSVDKELGAQ